MNDPMQIDAAEPMIGLPHELADLTLAIAVRLHLGGHKPVWDHTTAHTGPMAVDDDDGMPSELDILESYLMVVNDLSVTQAVAVLAHPDYDIVEYCMDGHIDKVRLHLTYAQQGRLHLSDSVMGECIDEASANGDIELLELLTGAFPGRKLYYSCQAMDRASAGGHIDCLEWWLARQDRFKLRYSAAAMDSATGSGLVNVLDWWLKSDLSVLHSSDGLGEAFLFGHLAAIEWWWSNREQLYCDFEACAIDLLTCASDGNQVAVLEWWMDSGTIRIPFSFRANFLSRPANHGHLETLDFWYEFLASNKPEILDKLTTHKDLPLLYSNMPQIRLLDWFESMGFSLHADKHWPIEACSHGRLDMLMWFHAKGFYEDDCANGWMDSASGAGHLDILDWIVSTIADPMYSAKALDSACANGRLDVIRWWFDSGMELQYTIAALDGASQNGRLEVLKLWMEIGRPFEYSEAAVDQASKYGWIDVLEWWLNEAEMPLKYTDAAMDEASDQGRVDVLEWWLAQSKAQGLELKYNLPIALETRSVACLDWWRASGLIPLDYESDACPRLGDPELVVNWWVESGIKIKHNPEPRRLDYLGMHVGALEYWQQLGLPIRLESMDNDIWLGCRVPFSHLEWAFSNGHMSVETLDLNHFEPTAEAHMYNWLVDYAEGQGYDIRGQVSEDDEESM